LTELRLNILPVVFPPGVQKDVVYHIPRDDPDREKSFREQSSDGHAFHVFSFRDRVYFWAHSGQQLPATVDVASAVEVLPQLLPDAVVAHALREAVVDRLVDRSGFERLNRGIGAPTRLFRREHNIAAKALSSVANEDEIGNEAGVFPYLAVQGISLGDETKATGKVAIVLDAGLVNRLDVPLANLNGAGVELIGMRVVWDHGEHCRCGFEAERGVAGHVVSGDARPTVDISTAIGKRTVIAECLRPLVSRQQLERYFATVLASPGNVHRLIDNAITSFHDATRQWKMLEATRKALNPVTIFSATDVTLGAPVVADVAGTNDVKLLPPVEEAKLNFQYGASVIFQGAARGLLRHGPYDKNVVNRLSDVTAVILCPDELAADGVRLRRAIEEGVGQFPGLRDRYELSSLDVTTQRFHGRDAAAYAAAAHEATRPAPNGTKPTVVFLITHRDDRNARPGENPYLAAKAVLANADVASQAVTVEVVRQPDTAFQWSIQSIALQVYAKIGNIPYVLHDDERAAELVIGIGRHDLYDYKGFKKQIFGAAAAFRQDGDFLFAGSTAPVIEHDNYEETLAELIRSFVERFEGEQGKKLERLVLHVFKRTGRRESYAVEQALEGRDVKYGLVHVNRDTPLWLVEGSDSAIAAAPAGTVVSLADRDRLLMTGEYGSGKKRNPHPLRLTLDWRSTYTDMDRLTRQIQGFTATSWRGFRPTHEPSTILYGRLLAEKVSQLLPYNFDPARASAIGGRPWFL
jgi:hypothetical protein